jgi:hypothetical protein
MVCLARLTPLAKPLAAARRPAAARTPAPVPRAALRPALRSSPSLVLPGRACAYRPLRPVVVRCARRAAPHAPPCRTPRGGS